MANGNGNGKSQTSERILDAADELLVEVGYDGISMRAVAERAGVNKALVFYHWGNKKALIERVLERYYAAHIEALSSAVDGRGSVPDRLHRLLDAYLDFIESNLRYPRIVQQQVAGGNDHEELIRKNLAALFRWTTELLAEIAPERGPQAARHFFVDFSAIVVNYYTYAPVLAPVWGDDPLSPEALSERREHVHWMVDTLLERLTATA